MFGGLAEADAVEEGGLECGARGAASSESFPDKDLEGEGVAAFGKFAGGGGVGGVPDDVEGSARGVYGGGREEFNARSDRQNLSHRNGDRKRKGTYQLSSRPGRSWSSPRMTRTKVTTKMRERCCG